MIAISYLLTKKRIVLAISASIISGRIALIDFTKNSELIMGTELDNVVARMKLVQLPAFPSDNLLLLEIILDALDELLLDADFLLALFHDGLEGGDELILVLSDLFVLFGIIAPSSLQGASAKLSQGLDDMRIDFRTLSNPLTKGLHALVVLGEDFIDRFLNSSRDLIFEIVLHLELLPLAAVLQGQVDEDDLGAGGSCFFDFLEGVFAEDLELDVVSTLLLLLLLLLLWLSVR